MTRQGWLLGLVVLLGAAAFTGVRFWSVRRPPSPPAAKLPPSARMLLQPFRKDSLDLTLAANGEVEYRVAMQSGATLVFSWTASRGTVSCQFANQNPVNTGESHGGFVAQSSGWYRWRWRNQTGNATTIHLKLNGYYEPAGMPYDR